MATLSATRLRRNAFWLCVSSLSWKGSSWPNRKASTRAIRACGNPPHSRPPQNMRLKSPFRWYSPWNARNRFREWQAYLVERAEPTLSTSNIGPPTLLHTPNMPHRIKPAGCRLGCGLLAQACPHVFRASPYRRDTCVVARCCPAIGSSMRLACPD